MFDIYYNIIILSKTHIDPNPRIVRAIIYWVITITHEEQREVGG
jgi:hypothetical protein